MWEEYFPEAEVYAMDIKPDILINEGRIKSFWFDQSDARTYPLEQLGSNFDFIVEDGSHNREHQLVALKTLVPLLAPGGIYIAEDCGYMDHDTLVQFCRDIPWPSELVEFKSRWLPREFAACVVIRND